MQPQEFEVTIEELNRCSQAVESLFRPMVEQFRGDWTSTEEGQKDKAESFEDFSKREGRHVKQEQSLALFAIGRLPQAIPLGELKEFVWAYFSMPVIFLPDLENMRAITSLDLSGVPNLLELECEGNLIKNLDLSLVPKLQKLNCSDNAMAELILPNLPDLVELKCVNWIWDTEAGPGRYLEKMLARCL